MMTDKFKSSLGAEKNKIKPLYNKTRNRSLIQNSKTVEMSAINEESKESINFVDSIEEIEK